MPLLNTADKVYRGSGAADRVYMGSNLVWQAVAPYTPLTNTAEGGSNGTTVTVGNSGGGSGDAFNWVPTAGVTFSTAAALAGSLGYTVPAGTGAIVAFGWDDVSGHGDTTAIVEFKFRPVVAATTESRILQLLNAAGASMGGLMYGSAGRIRVMQGTTGISASLSPALVAGATYTIRLEFTVGLSAAGSYVFTILDSTGATFWAHSGAITTTAADPITRARFGRLVTAANFGGDLHFDAISVTLGTVTTPPPVNEKPGASNTGHTGTLEPFVGNKIVTVEGTVLENLDISGYVEVRAANVIIRNCRVRGGNVTGYRLIMAYHSAVSNLLVEECTLVPDYPNTSWTGVEGHDYTARRNEVCNTVDGFGAYNTNANGSPANVLIENNWVHDLHCWTPDPSHGDNRSHNDGVQVQGNGGVTIRYNNLDCMPGPTSAPELDDTVSCVMVNDRSGQAPNVVVTNNWLNGGAATINVADGGLTSASSVDIRNNLFGAGSVGYKIYKKASGASTPGLPNSTGPDVNNGNLIEATGSPVTVTVIA